MRNSWLVRSAALAALVWVGFGLAQAQPGMMEPSASPGWSQQQMPGYGSWGQRGDGVHARGWGHDMAHGMGYGMGYGMGPGMGYGSMMGGGMMGGGPLPADATPLPMAEVQSRLQAILSAFPAGAQIADVMPFANNVYAQVVDAQGQGVVELLVNRYSGVVTPEPGPNMMWNLNGPMAGQWGAGAAGMMGGYGSGSTMSGGSQASASPRYDQQQAQDLAARFLSRYAPGATVLQGQAFEGYYTFDYGVAASGVQGMAVQGMLSVNAFTGAVWPHTWHGAYIGGGQ